MAAVSQIRNGGQGRDYCLRKLAEGKGRGEAMRSLNGSEPGFAAPRHIHHECDELFYVLAGEFQFLLGEERVSASPGTFVFIPRGTIHAPKVVGSEAGKMLVAFVPGGAEGAFDEFAELAAVTDTDELAERVQAVARKYASEIVGPPL